MVLHELAAMRENIDIGTLAIHRDGHASLPAQREDFRRYFLSGNGMASM